jgi:hypothetical protein
MNNPKPLLFLAVVMGISLALCAAFRAAARPTAAATIEIPLGGGTIAEAHLGVADFNGDGKKEIVAAATDGKLYVVDGATYTVMWEKQLADYTTGYTETDIRTGVAIGDLDNNGRLEIVAATGGEPSWHKVGALVVLTYVGGSDPFALMPGWPQLSFDELGHPDNFSNPDGVPDGFWSTPALGDLDGNGDLEIVIGGFDRRLHARHHDGSYVAGWPIDRDNYYWRDSMSSPALADIDGDGLVEVIIGSNNYLIPGCPNPYLFYVINGDSSYVDGFPVQTSQNTVSSPAVGDINGDGWLDIVVGTGHIGESCGQAADGHKVYAWDHEGKLLPGWPQATANNVIGSPALGDIDGDEDLEVVIGCGGLGYHCTTLYAWHGDGSNVTGFPVNPVSESQPYSPVLADYDGDGVVEIMVVGEGATAITILEPNGTLSPDTHHTTAETLFSTPVVDDIDGDGLLETIIAGGDGSGKGMIYIWEEKGLGGTGKLPWPMFHRNIRRTGLLPPTYQLSGRVMDENGVPFANVTISTNLEPATTTDGNGLYTFAKIDQGRYTLTPKLGNYLFSPPTRAVTLPPNATNQNFTVVYQTIAGAITDFGGYPLPGVTVTLSSGPSVATDAGGGYSLAGLHPGSYTITPTLAGYRFEPASAIATVPPDALTQNFYALPTPISLTLTPSLTSSLTYTDPRGTVTWLEFPAATVSQPVTITLTPTQLVADKPLFWFTWHAFELAAYRGGTLLPGFSFDRPITATIHYPGLSGINEATLELDYWDNGVWFDAADICASTYDRRLDAKELAIPLCRTGLLALFGQPEGVYYLPLIRRP